MRARSKIAALVFTGMGLWMAHEGFSPSPYIPTKGDVPTIGYGSTYYEDGSKVKLSDPPITRERAAKLASNLSAIHEKQVKESLEGIDLYQEEYDVYVSFVGQFGISNLNKSIKRNLKAGNYIGACQSLLKYKFVNGYDCSTPGNKICWGVWERQLERYKTCMSVQ